MVLSNVTLILLEGKHTDTFANNASCEDHSEMESMKKKSGNIYNLVKEKRKGAIQCVKQRK